MRKREREREREREMDDDRNVRVVPGGGGRERGGRSERRRRETIIKKGAHRVVSASKERERVLRLIVCTIVDKEQLYQRKAMHSCREYWVITSHALLSCLRT